MHFPFPIFDLSFDLEWVAGNATANSESQISTPQSSHLKILNRHDSARANARPASLNPDWEFEIQNWDFEI
jgi:hypothetical protein